MYKENFSSINDVPSNNANTENVAASSHSSAAETLSTWPIVTSVSDFADASLNLSNGTASGHIHNETLVVTAVNDILAPNADTCAAPSGVTASTSPTVATKAHAKPNIVVLNESIVKSLSVFQLHTCQCCQLKFFSVESLNQHYNVAHQSQTPLEEGSQLRAEQQKQQGEHAQQHQQLQVRQLQHPYNQQQQQNMLTLNNNFQQQQQQQHGQAQLPMVSVPSDYLWKPYGGTSGDLRNEPYNFNCKVEKDFPLTTAQADITHKAEDNLSYQQPNIFEQPFGLADSHHTKNTFITPNSIPKD
ncbi:E3 ubiquitin-protein ligase TRIM33-like, partial [Rhagoletis pomonella]|uniref:E3 ubiquitin-protein ligase TRIM33-like n=1 Tax=Rhagoletis pomonella TaxID=28610 RepID=UPI0017848416